MSDQSYEPLLLNQKNTSKTLDETIERCIGEFGWAQLLQSVLVSLSWIFDAQQTFISVFTDTHAVNEWSLQKQGVSSVLSGLPASSFFIGCLIGGLVLSTLADTKLGRKNMLVFSCLVMSVAGTITSISANIWIYSFLRFLSGFGRATIGTCALVLSTELVGNQWRGQVGIIGFVCFTIGFLSLPIIAFLNKESSWRVLYLWTCLPTILYSILVHFFVCESPRWLYVRGNKEEFVSTLKSITTRSSLTLSFFGSFFEFEDQKYDNPRRLEKCLRELGFRGNSYRLLVGDMNEVVKMDEEAKSKPIKFSHDIVPRLMPFIHKTIIDYGKNYFIWLGPNPAMLIMDPEHIREILSKSNIFQNPPPSLTKLLAEGILSYEADKWAKHRRIINPAFNLDKLKHMVPSFHLTTCEMLSIWEKIVSTEGSEVDVWPHLQTLTSDAISRTAFGSSYEEGRKIHELQQELAKIIVKETEITYIRFLPTKEKRRMNRLHQEVRSLVLRIINKRMNEIEAYHPFLLKVVTMIIQEVLRLYPPIFLMGREVHKETKLGNLSIPSGVQLLLPTILLHHDQEIWGEDVEEFNPERFSEGVNRATKGKFAYFPFSWGPRNCIGQNFAMLEAKMALAMILQQFAFEVSPSYAHVPYSVFTLLPQYGAQLILNKL